MKKTSNEELVLLGKVGSPSGLKGEARITLYQQDSTNLKEGKVLLLKHGNEVANSGRQDGRSSYELKVERVRYQGGRPVVKLEGIDDRNAAEELRGLEVYIEPEDLEPLPEGEHYVRNLIGCRVVDTAACGSEGCEIGVLRDVIQNTAQSILEIETPDGKTVLVPAVDEFLEEINEEERIIKLKLIPGFID